MNKRMKKIFQGQMSDYEFQQVCADFITWIIAMVVILGMLYAVNYLGAMD